MVTQGGCNKGRAGEPEGKPCGPTRAADAKFGANADGRIRQGALTADGLHATGGTAGKVCLGAARAAFQQLLPS